MAPHASAQTAIAPRSSTWSITPSRSAAASPSSASPSTKASDMRMAAPALPSSEGAGLSVTPLAPWPTRNRPTGPDAEPMRAETISPPAACAPKAKPFAPVIVKPPRPGCATVSTKSRAKPASGSVWQKARRRSPAAIRGSRASRCRAVPARAMQPAPSTMVPSNGSRTRCRPDAAMTMPSSVKPAPVPPMLFGNATPSQPSWAYSAQCRSPASGSLARDRHRSKP